MTGVDDAVRTKYMCSSTIMFRPICIAQISSLATACIGQPLLTFWSHTEQSRMFVLIVAASIKSKKFDEF